jgi:addiction module RelE/StbE family toxin
MWEIYEHRGLVRKLQRLPIEILRRYEKWKDIVTVSGPEGLRLIKGFHDEALQGDWKGYRSSRLGLKYRLVYMIDNEKVFVKVMNITPHDYRRN